MVTLRVFPSPLLLGDLQFLGLTYASLKGTWYLTVLFGHIDEEAEETKQNSANSVTALRF